MKESGSSLFLNAMFMNTIGMMILKDVLVEASYYITKTNYRHKVRTQETEKDYQQSFMFLRGTGFERIITHYHLPLDPDKIRDGFFTIFNRRDLINEQNIGHYLSSSGNSHI